MYTFTTTRELTKPYRLHVLACTFSILLVRAFQIRFEYKSLRTTFFILGCYMYIYIYMNTINLPYLGVNYNTKLQWQ